MTQESIEQMIYNETKKRLETMENPDYEFPPKAGIVDIIGILSFLIISLLLIVLCIGGVIK